MLISELGCVPSSGYLFNWGSLGLDILLECAGAEESNILLVFEALLTF